MNKNDKKKTLNRSQKGLVDPRTIKEYKVYVETELLEFLYFKMPSTPKKTVKRILTNHQVSVGGVPVSQFNYKIYPDDVVIVSQNRISKTKTVVKPDIIFEDEYIIAINKPSGLLSIASDREKGRTAFRLVSDYVEAREHLSRVFVVHRLDEDTSGVLIFAKSNEVKEALQNRWNDLVSKRGYYAIVEGQMDQKEATFKDYLEQNDLNLVFVSHNKTKGKLSITSYKEVAYNNGYSLLDVDIATGRKNQIRVQLGHRGHFVVGDDKYGEPSDPLGRLGLHAYELDLTNPISGREYKLTAPMPEGFKKLMFSKSGKVEAHKAPKKETVVYSKNGQKAMKAKSQYKHWKKNR